MKKITLLFVLFSAIAFAQKPIFTTAKVKSATVYFNAAELSQTTSVNLPAGTSEIVIKNVADYLNENTVQIGAPNSVTVLSVQFTQNYISEYEIDETNPAIKKVRDSISWTEKEIKKTQIDAYSHQQTIALLDGNQNVAGANSGLNVAELMKLVDYYKAKRTELDNNIVALKEKETKLGQKLSALKSKLEINTQKEEKNSKGKLIIQVMNEVAGLVNLDINYITNNASWQPFYDLRADNVNSPINMMYKAQVTQWTGIDWKKVNLTLSSGNPNQNNQAPILSPWFLRYGNFNYYRGNVNSKYKDGDKQNVYNQIQGSAAGVVVEEDNAVYNVASVSGYTTIQENQLNVSFDIDIPYDILSNSKPHSVALKDIKLPATYKYYAAPRVEKEAFLLAEINDYSKYNLLPGEANIIFEGMYVGKTNINPNQTSDTLNLSMGRDKKVSIKREKVVDKSGTKFLSSKKEQTFTFDITVRNNKKEMVNMLLKDQYPLSTDKEIEVELLESNNAKENKETGILTWDLKLNPNETKKIRISYKVKYPKDKVIDNL
ncbi:DUF4139 domain-containing protein [Flavobacterium solisilvae]|uniref:Mucoidy inhibitor MuiA family protein n=1 Tax=Flavobacterium solisilvae TaxID=1852019 RepID=A0ABX1QX11_9FLAO|nr:mucoidy inhibitor MuiA family protein [Flavobacterium solisilvae]NMH25658.1 mucoidy inhibitor MuiA family protein [Flavobacterium solisilvae]